MIIVTGHDLQLIPDEFADVARRQKLIVRDVIEALAKLLREGALLGPKRRGRMTGFGP